MIKYEEFLLKKKIINCPTGLNVKTNNTKLFDFQRDIVNWALKRGRASIFAGCGLGKTPMQLCWANEIVKNIGDVLIVAPLAVSQQTVREGIKFGINVEYSRTGQKSKCGITITNYEMLEHFNPEDYKGVVLDESSILKAYTGKICNQIIQMFSNTPFRLACTATPSPNDLIELGNHAEFMGSMTREEMLAMFFVHDGGETQKWRLKGHAKKDFWKWVCSWAVLIEKPSDLGYEDKDFILPPLNMHEIVVDVDHTKAQDTLFLLEAKTLKERQHARKNSTDIRCNKASEIVNGSKDYWLIWCDRNDESKTLTDLITGGVEIKGSDSIQHKENSMFGFSQGNIKRLITKPSIAGFGMNWQHCCNVIFVGLSDSYEQFYQAIRRSWRFGQKRPVNCYVITAETEGAVVSNIKRKEEMSRELITGMIENMSVYNQQNIKGTTRNITEYEPQSVIKLADWL